MGTKYLIDSNAISDFLTGQLPENGVEFMANVVDDIPNISVINRIEVLSHLIPHIQLVRDFVSGSNILDLDESIILKTIALRRSKRIKTPDAIIAATALVFDMILITHNISDFEGIPNLKILDPHNL